MTRTVELDSYEHRRRLRKGVYPDAMVPVVTELLDEIDRLKADRRALVEAALPFADFATCLDPDCPHKVCRLNMVLGVPE